MKRAVTRLGLPMLALAGIVYAVYFTTIGSRRELPAASQLALPAENPYPAAVSGSGLIEASTRNIAIGSFASGIVVRVPVIEGQWVKAGNPLFQLDPRLAEAELAIAERDATAAKASVAEAQAELADFEDQVRRPKA